MKSCPVGRVAVGDAYAVARAGADPFAQSRELFEQRVTWLADIEASGLEHGELEARLEFDGRELLRVMYQEHLDLRAAREARIDQVAGSDGAHHGCVERGHRRPLGTVFGQVRFSRIAYRARGHENLCPADAALNLPGEMHSHGLRRLCAIESARGSYDDAVAAVARASAQRLGKRQAERLAHSAAVDFEAFYAQRAQAASGRRDVLILSCDGKGLVMVPGALREQTRRQAARSATKLQARLSKGEKRGHKRMAEVGAVYDATPVIRIPADGCPSTTPSEALLSPGRWPPTSG